MKKLNLEAGRLLCQALWIKTILYFGNSARQSFLGYADYAEFFMAETTFSNNSLVTSMSSIALWAFFFDKSSPYH